MLNVNVLTEFASPHMMDFWGMVNSREDVRLKIFFEEEIHPEKWWGRITENFDSEIACWSELSIRGKLRWIRRMSSVPVDVWVLCDNYRFWEHHLLASWMRRRSVPTVYLAERTYWECRRSTGTRDWRNVIYRALKKAMVPFLVRDFDALACYGSWAVEQYKAMAPSRYVFPTEYYVNLGDLRQIERPQKGRNGHINLGTCGALISRKGLDCVVSNLELIGQFPNWRLKVAGDGPLRSELESAVSEELKPRVDFLGHVSNHEMKAFWEDIDVLLFPSLFDGWGMVVVEALAAGVPVISGPNVGAARQYIRNEYNGEICDVDDSFLQAITPILEAPEKLNELSVNARASVRDYRPEIGAKNFIEHLKILTEQGSILV